MVAFCFFSDRVIHKENSQRTIKIQTFSPREGCEGIHETITIPGNTFPKCPDICKP